MSWPLLLSTNRGILLAGWVHYLAFDLLVAARLTASDLERGVPQPFTWLSQVLTLVAGPIGWLLHLSGQAVWRKRQKALPV